jgi:hypothetical protein
LLCVDAWPLPRLGQIELVDNCDDNVFFQDMRRAYERIRSHRVFSFEEDTPHWVRKAVERFYKFTDDIQPLLI